MSTMDMLLDHLSDGEIDSESIEKLRSLVIDLALRGKLVPQDPDDENAKSLLSKLGIDTEQDHDIGHIIPATWEIAQIGQITTFQYGKGLTKEEQTGSGGIPVFGSNGIVGEHDNFIVSGPSIVIGRKGSAGALNKCQSDCWPTDVCFFVQTPQGIDLDYWYLVLKNAKLPKLSGGLKPGLNRNHAHKLLVPIPPTLEQHRIVAKVDFFMKFLDDLELSLETKEITESKLRKTLLSELTMAEDGKSMVLVLQSIAGIANKLFNKSEDIENLRQAILLLAISGKLVHQSDEEEPASVLVERIAEIKERLIKDKKIRKPKNLPEVDEIPFSIPESWQWCRFETIHEKLGAGSTPKGGKEVYTQEGIKFLRSQNVYNDGLRLDDVALIPPQIHERMKNTAVRPNDVLLNITGGSIARSTVVPEEFDTANVNQHVAIVRQVIPSMNRWVHLFLISPFGYDSIMSVEVGISREGLSMGRLKMFTIPIPPLPEIHRIIDRVEELMSLCDSLQSGLNHNHITHPILIDSLIMQSLEAI